MGKTVEHEFQYGDEILVDYQKSYKMPLKDLLVYHYHCYLNHQFVAHETCREMTSHPHAYPREIQKKRRFQIPYSFFLIQDHFRFALVMLSH